MTTERQPLTFEAAMSELVAAIGNIERIKSVSADDRDRVLMQGHRLLLAANDLYVFDANAADA